MFIRSIAILAAVTILGGLPAEAQTLGKAERVCASTKLKATGKKVLAKLKCEAKAIIQELPGADTECLSKAEGKFSQSFTKAEVKGGCVSDADAVAVESNVDTFVAEEVIRQKLGTVPLPSCTMLAAPCGSCGAGFCVSHLPGGELVCVDTAGVGFTECTSDAQCTTPQICITASGPTACALTCP